MKPTDFYNGTVQPNGTELTDSIVNIADPDADYMDAYYMGYVNFYLLPENLKFHQIQLDGGSLLIIDQTDRNHAWGFCNIAQVSGLSYSDVIYTYNGNIHTKKIDPTPRFINDIKMSQHAVANGLRLYLRYIFIPANDLDSNDSAYSPSKSDGSYTMNVNTLDLPVISATIGGINYTGYDAFFNGSDPINFGSATINGDSVLLEFYASDFDNTENPTSRREITAGGSDYVLFAQLTSFIFYDYGAYISDSNNIAAFGVVPFLEFDALFDNDGIKTMAVGTCSDFARLTINLDYYTGNFITTASISVESITGGYYQGNFYIINNTMYRGETGSEYWYASVSPNQYPGLGRNGIIRGRHITDYASTSANNFYIYTFLKPSDIWNSIIPYHKLDTLHDSNNATVPNKTYTPDYSTSIYDSNVPTQERKQDTLANIADYLMSWQLPDNVIAIDDFDIADMPIQPTPPEPGDGADSGGDNILPYDFTNTPLSAANNFTTLYALSTGQVAEFGAIMWAKLSDDNFWHSVGVTFSNDFSINPADMMRYFIFLRYYPFDLKPYASTYASGIFIGRSTIPIQFPLGVEYPRRVNRNLIQIDGGTVTPKLSAPYDTDDFRVMDPSTQIQAHIPFCGTVQLSAAECYGKELHLRYVVDLQSGAIQASITVQSNTLYIVATLAGTCGASVQITSNNNIEFLTRIATVATGGVSSAATMATQGEKIAGAEGAAVGAVAGALTGTVSALAGLPPVTVHKQGSTTGFANYGGDPRAYVTIQTPKRSKPASYAKAVGYISNKQAKIADLSGYTEMINPDLSGITAHQDELEEIRQLLETGFFA